LKEFFYVFDKEEDSKQEQEPKKECSQIPFAKDEDNSIEKERELKRWKQTFSYYSMHPLKFGFSLKDL